MEPQVTCIFKFTLSSLCSFYNQNYISKFFTIQNCITNPVAELNFADLLFPLFSERHLLYILYRLYKGNLWFVSLLLAIFLCKKLIKHCFFRYYLLK